VKLWQNEAVIRKATSAIARPGHLLEVRRSDGSCVLVDVTPYLRYGIFRDLEDELVFSKVRIDAAGGAEWPNGASLSPELLAADEPAAAGVPATKRQR